MKNWKFNSYFLADYLKEIIGAYRNDKIEVLDSVLSPIEVFVRDDIRIYNSNTIRRLERLLLGDL